MTARENPASLYCRKGGALTPPFQSVVRNPKRGGRLPFLVHLTGVSRNMLPLSPGRCLLATALLLSILAAPRVTWASIKLCMKDGTYQMVASYEVHGERVRYFSVERSEWEEVPTSLVDFDATKRAQQETKAAEKQQLEEAKQVEQERFYKPPDQGMEVAPGIRLPGDDGIFTVDGQRLVRLVQSAGELVTDKKRAAMVLAVPLPVVKTRSLVVLEGPKAAIRLERPVAGLLCSIRRRPWARNSNWCT